MPPIQEQVLHHRSGFTKSHADGERIVKILVTAAHSAQVKRRIAANLISATARIGADDQRHGGYYVKTLEGLADPVPTGPQSLQLLRREVGRVEDRQPAVRQLSGEFEILRTDCRKIDGNV